MSQTLVPIPLIESLHASHDGPLPRPVRRGAERGLVACCGAQARTLGRLAEQARSLAAAARRTTSLDDAPGSRRLDALVAEVARRRSAAIIWSTLLQELDKPARS